MRNWHPFPTALYSFAEQTPGTVLLESSRPGAAIFSRVFTDPVGVLEVRTSAEIAGLFPQIEDAMHRGHFVAGFLAYDGGTFFEPSAALRPGRATIPWHGSGSTSAATASITQRVDSSTANRRILAHLLSLRPPLPRRRRSPLTNSSSGHASSRFMSGFAPAMCISSISRSRCM